MNCSELERWLDEGRPGGERVSALLHARRCLRCAPHLRADDELRALLARIISAEPAPAFGVAVLARIRAAAGEATDRPVRSLWLRFMAGWLDVAAEPAVSVSLAVAMIFALHRSAVSMHTTAVFGAAVQWIHALLK